MSQKEQDNRLDEIINKAVAEHEQNMFEQVMHQNNLHHENVARLSQRWWKGFVALEAMYLMTIEFAQMFNEKHGKKTEKGVSYSHKHFALLNIHGRACQVYAEMLCLMKNGFTDGAFALWRTLFELSVYAVFIYENDDETALAYIEHSKVDEREKEYEETWAKSAPCFKNEKRKVTFKKIFWACKFSAEQKESWDKQYTLACKIVHASPQGSFKRLSNSGMEDGVLRIGGSNWGLHLPAEHMANSFYQTSAAFFGIYPDADVLFATHMLRKWIDVILKHIYETVRYCFPEVPDAERISKSYDEYVNEQN